MGYAFFLDSRILFCWAVKKGQIVKVDKDKYLNSYLSVGHPPYYNGLDYIYEDRGEVLDLRIFETREHALDKMHWLVSQVQQLGCQQICSSRICFKTFQRMLKDTVLSSEAVGYY
ncbi:uncharacterized protein LOC131181436 [Hevea brasiliensis]|uniref:uncharacterized protein LOC131181436 n=1 Tax=Hevea brasiliensis TaxID=3981 RepID=UPI0025DA2DD9|nr:uncharacterized protein LOC131181436 [Hevea brasiliensis]